MVFHYYYYYYYYCYYCYFYYFYYYYYCYYYYYKCRFIGRQVVPPEDHRALAGGALLLPRTIIYVNIL